MPKRPRLARPNPDRRHKLKLRIPQILRWADAFHKRFGRWPHRDSPSLPEMLGDTWRRVDNASMYGLRSLPGKSSLAKLLAAKRKVRIKSFVPDLTEKQILEWADAHRNRTGKWPTMESGEVKEAPGEVWVNIDAVLRTGGRGLPGENSLAKLLKQHRSKRHRNLLPLLTVEKILAWADRHYELNGR